MGIFVGLNLSVLQRMKGLWGCISTHHMATLAEIQDILSPNNSFKNYRSLLLSSSGPVCPYLGVFLTDLTFIDSGNPDRIGEGDINFTKQEMIFRIVDQIRSFQSTPYTFTVIQPLFSFLSVLCPLTENQLYACSLWREKRK